MSIDYVKHPDHPESILIREFHGVVGVDDIINSWKYLIENKLVTSSLQGVINNITTCELKMDMDSFKVLMGYLKKTKILKKIKLAVICTDPKVIVFPTVGQVAEQDLKIKPFSTMEPAVEWILK